MSESTMDTSTVAEVNESLPVTVEITVKEALNAANKITKYLEAGKLWADSVPSTWKSSIKVTSATSEDKFNEAIADMTSVYCKETDLANIDIAGNYLVILWTAICQANANNKITEFMMQRKLINLQIETINKWINNNKHLVNVGEENTFEEIMAQLNDETTSIVVHKKVVDYSTIEKARASIKEFIALRTRIDNEITACNHSTKVNVDKVIIDFANSI